MLSRGSIALGLCLALSGCNQILGIHEPTLLDASTGDGGSGAGDVAGEISAGYLHTCARLEDGSAKCWGHNEYGKLGLGDTLSRGGAAGEMGANLPGVELGQGLVAASIMAGSHHTCARLTSGALKCWGQNNFGQLGQGDTLDRGDDPHEMGDTLAPINLGAGLTVTGVATGAYHTCAALSDERVKCWGDNDEGTLGLGDTSARGAEPQQMGDALPEVDLGGGVKVRSVVAGSGFTCALTTSDQVKCWGTNADGQLGQGHSAPRGVSPMEMGANLPFTDLGAGKTVKAISAGKAHVCVIVSDDTVKCWGKNGDGQLGLGDTQSRGVDLGEMGDSLPAVDLGPGEKAKAIAAGGSHTCAVLLDGRVKCWGNNAFGQLGLEDSNSRGGAPAQMGAKLPAVNLGTGKTAKAIVAGGLHTCAHLNDGSVKCWGMNLNGQLGVPLGNQLGLRPGEMGDALPPVKLYSSE